MTIKEAAEEIGMRYDALIRRVQRGYVPAEKVGDRVYVIHVDEVAKITPRNQLKKKRPKKRQERSGSKK